MSLFSLLLRMLLALALVACGPGAGAGAGVGVAADVQVGDAAPVALHGMAGSHSTSMPQSEAQFAGGCHRAAEAAAVAGTSVDQGADNRHAVAAEAGGSADFTDCCEPGCDPTACGGCLHHCAADIAGPGLAGHHAVPQAGPVFFSTRHTSPVLSGVFRPPIG